MLMLMLNYKLSSKIKLTLPGLIILKRSPVSQEPTGEGPQNLNPDYPRQFRRLWRALRIWGCMCSSSKDRALGGGQSGN